MKTQLIIITFFLVLFSGIPAFADTITYPKVSSVSPTTLKPGDTLTLQGANFGTEGNTYCFGNYDQATKTFPEKKLMTYKTVIGAYKQGTSPTSGTPDYRLNILSVSSDTITAQIPTNMTNGVYMIGYNAEYPRGVCSGYGEILVGFARYDQITVTGGREAAIILSPTRAPTVAPISPTVIISPTTLPKQLTPKPQPRTQPKDSSFFKILLRFLGWGE
jgi:hypothetical protein